ncbi:Expansin-YoaJ [Colletotrichum sidae]|uniref:Expansin-YoaJ n=2 Tax=Colletotrichum orbiculare species complex TaxID=2707354 RepID=N4W1H6_COLOR|nr:Expansin-YoaJ [Colletotrichum orbiculare MAFF 240422]TEA16500.1 Expansin-YoaJ [Colletotrichum sidae]
MKYHVLLLAASAAHMAFAKPIKACPARSRSTKIITYTVGPDYSSGPTLSPVQPTPIQQPAPVEASAEPSVAVTTSEASAAPSAESVAPASSQAPSAAASIPVASSAPISGSAVKQGKSTFYGGNTSGGMCSFSTYAIPSGLFGTAFSGQAWDSAAECGACVKVTGPNGDSITAMIVDQCPECDEGHLDLFQDAFTKLGSVSDGIISTSYEFVKCGITSPIKLHNKSGTSSHWFSMQVLNHNEPVTSLEVSTNGGSTWQKTQRAEYNFFENQSGFGTDSVDVRVTSSSGKTVIVKNVSVASDSEQTASGNF